MGTGTPPHPCVLVDYMDDVLFGGGRSYDTDTWFVFGSRMEDELREQLSRALAASFHERESQRMNRTPVM